ncbi:MAG: hypothetical protein GY745_02315 [Actinomycetia bacterium]|nr:hypothetical protein [Actinomycetes bacterium]
MTDPSVPVLAVLGVVTSAIALRLLVVGRQRLAPRGLRGRPVIGRRPVTRHTSTLPRALSAWEALVVSSQTHPQHFRRQLLPRLATLAEASPPNERLDQAWARLEMAARRDQPLDLDQLQDWLDALDPKDR